MNEWLLIVLIAAVAFAYAMVGHGGASGYLALMGVAGIAPESMRSSALVLNVCVSGLATVQFARAGHFRWRLFWPFALLSVPCAFLGAGLELSDTAYHRLLGLCLLVASLRLLGAFNGSPTAKNQPQPIAAMPIGAGIGLLSGMLGIGGGVLLSPVLLLCAWADARTTAAVSAPFIFVNSSASLVNLRFEGDAFHPGLAAWTVVAIAGGLLGSWLGARRAPEPRLRQALGIVLLLACIRLVWP